MAAELAPGATGRRGEPARGDGSRVAAESGRGPSPVARGPVAGEQGFEGEEGVGDNVTVTP